MCLPSTIKFGPPQLVKMVKFGSAENILRRYHDKANNKILIIFHETFHSFN